MRAQDGAHRREVDDPAGVVDVVADARREQVEARHGADDLAAGR